MSMRECAVRICQCTLHFCLNLLAFLFHVFTYVHSGIKIGCGILFLGPPVMNARDLFQNFRKIMD